MALSSITGGSGEDIGLQTNDLGDDYKTSSYDSNMVTITEEIYARVLASILTTLGDMFVRNNSGDVDRFPAGTDDYMIVADSSDALGVKYIESIYNILTTKGDIILYDQSGDIVRHPIGTDDQMLIADSTQQNGMKWSDSPTKTLTTKGDVLTRNATDPERLAVGTDDQMIVADSAQTGGLVYKDSHHKTLTTKGDILVRNATNPQRLAVGTDGYVLVSDSGQTEGVKWESKNLTVDTTNVSNPPTDAELDSIFGAPATVGTGFTALIDDSGAGSNFYQVSSDGTNWWIFTGTKAV